MVTPEPGPEVMLDQELARLMKPRLRYAWVLAIILGMTIFLSFNMVPLAFRALPHLGTSVGSSLGTLAVTMIVLGIGILLTWRCARELSTRLTRDGITQLRVGTIATAKWSEVDALWIREHSIVIEARRATFSIAIDSVADVDALLSIVRPLLPHERVVRVGPHQ